MSDGFPKPWMSDGEVECFINLIRSFDKIKHCDVLEWGVGGSTVYYSWALETVEYPRSWIAVDHDSFWVERCCSISPSWVKFLCVPTGGDCSKPELWVDYINPPSLSGLLFDLIIVDGRMRRRCLEQAARMLRDKDSLVVLHDAHREYYHSAFTRFSNGRFLRERIWVGQRLIQV